MACVVKPPRLTFLKSPLSRDMSECRSCNNVKSHYIFGEMKSV